MKPPFCDFCQHNHWRREKHILIGGPEPSNAAKALVRLSPVHASSVEVEIPQTVDDVRRIVTEINDDIARLYDDMDRLGKRLLVIHDSGLWRDMGYQTWEGFVAGELKVSRRHANRQLHHQRFLALVPGPSTFGGVSNGTQGPAPSERQTRDVRSDPAKVARVQRAVAQGVSVAEAVKRASSRTKDAATGASCEHPRTVQVTLCADCGRRLE